MQLGYTITIVNNLEAPHHEAGYTRLLSILYPLAYRVVLPLHLPHLEIHFPLSLEPPFYSLHVVFFEGRRSRMVVY